MKHFQIQNLHCLDVHNLNELKSFLNEKTLSKAVLHAVSFYPDKVKQNSKLSQRVGALELELELLKRDIDSYFFLHKKLQNLSESD